MIDPGAQQLAAAKDPATSADELLSLATAPEPAVLHALIDNPATPALALQRIAATPRIGVRKALLNSPRCPLVSSVAEDRLAYEGIDIGIFVDETSKRTICRALIGTGHRAESALVFSDPSLRVLDCLRTLHSLFTIHGGKKRDRKLNRHDYLRFLEAFMERGGQYEVLDLPMITLLTAMRLLGQDRLVRVMTEPHPERAMRGLRLLEAIAGSQAGEEGAHQHMLLMRWLARHDDWPLRMHDYLDRKYRRRASRQRNRAPRTLFQARFAAQLRDANRMLAGQSVRVHLPRSDRELRELGAAMANCIGSDHNVDDAVEGRHLILLVHPTRARRRGITCQFDATGRLLQARSFANGDADPALLEHALQAIRAILHDSVSVAADDA